MLKWIRIWWKAWKAKQNYPKAELERALQDAETLGCRDSAESLVLGCRRVCERFGWWSYETSTAAVHLHNLLFIPLGNSDRAATVTMGVVSHAIRWGNPPREYLIRARGILPLLAQRGGTISNEDKMQLAQLFPSITRDLRMRDNGLPTAEQVLDWAARGGYPEFGT